MVVNLSLDEQLDIDDLENVTKELRGLKELVGNFDSRAMTLQTELRLAHDDCCALLCSPKETLGLPKRLYGDGDHYQVDCQTTPYVTQLLDNANRTNMKLEEKIRRLRKDNRMPIPAVPTTQSTIDAGVQTDQLPHAKELPNPLLVVKEANRFSTDLMDVVFSLSSQLSQCHAQRDGESREHERFVQTLTEQFDTNLKKVRKQNFKIVCDVKEKIRSTYKLRTENLVIQNRELSQRLSKVEALEQTAQCTVNRLRHEIENLTKRMQTDSEENNLRI